MHSIENERDLHLNQSQWSLLLGFQASEAMSRGHDNIVCDTVYRCCCIYVCKGTCGCCQGADSPIRCLRSYVTLIQVLQERLYILHSISRVMNTLPTHNWLARCRRVPVNGPYLPLRIILQPHEEASHDTSSATSETIPDHAHSVSIHFLSIPTGRSSLKLRLRNPH